MDRINDHVDSKFRFVLLSAQRAEQLLRGAAPRVEVKSPKVAKTAMEELLNGLVEWDYGPAVPASSASED
jgi:DNA-directed RNA polymerase omega subunit